MTQTMVERVSRAIQDVMPSWLAEDGTVDDYALARAALEAMRKPTDEMVESGCNAWTPGVAGDGICTSWQAMIDAALTEGGE